MSEIADALHETMRSRTRDLLESYGDALERHRSQLDELGKQIAASSDKMGAPDAMRMQQAIQKYNMAQQLMSKTMSELAEAQKSIIRNMR
jgi:hypothetical protein